MATGQRKIKVTNHSHNTFFKLSFICILIWTSCHSLFLSFCLVIHDDISIAIQNSSLNFKYEILEKATECFDVSRKLGQGGAGSVFKGTLPDGKTVAVKRLFFNTRQWADEFFNEVNLINGIEHKNLVKLLGCSIEGPESLLVYEFVPNKSLDQVLFGKFSLVLAFFFFFYYLLKTKF